jgi:hypothetical protein
LAIAKSDDMAHAKSLRAIGQSLESLGVAAFVLENRGADYVVRSDALPDTAALNRKKSLSEKVWEAPDSSRKGSQLVVADGELCYTPNYVSWLEAQGQKKRRNFVSSKAAGSIKVSLLLRALGRHLDRAESDVFTIRWTGSEASVQYESANGKRQSETFSTDKLRELAVPTRFGRTRRN